MSDLVKHLDGVGEDIQRLSGLIRKACETETDPGVRQHLQQLNALMEHSFQKVRETLPAAERQMNKDTEEIAQATTRLKKEISDVEQRIKEAEQAAAQVPAPPAAPVFDPRLGTQLRDDLLARFAPKPASVRPGQSDRVDEGSVSKHWEETEEPEASVTPPNPVSPPQPPPSPPAPRKKPAKKEGTQIWDDLSQSED